ncbi:hypothetical protein O5D80_002314 [Batrachochytrium dendrobatidis]|nr:hypothetical protein O5D80_002314 [Batrachochytrium dendrobatidis]
MPASLIEIARTFNSFTSAAEKSVLFSTKQNPSTPSSKQLYIANTLVGFVPPFAIEAFSKSSYFTSTPISITLVPSLLSYQQRTHAIASMLSAWKSSGLFECLKGWRNEQYTVYGSNNEPIVAIERSAIGLFGVRSYGCHLNGYVRTVDAHHQSTIKMWVARRSYRKQTNPGMLDNIVGGGLPCGANPTANIIKESFEEAGISSDIASRAISVGVVSFWQDSSIRGYIPDTEFCYDLELDASFIPHPADGEVEEFFLWDLETVKDHLSKGEFTPEAGLVVVDFLIRHGAVHPLSEPAFLELSLLLRREFPFPGPSFV